MTDKGRLTTGKKHCMCRSLQCLVVTESDVMLFTSSE